MTKRRTRIAPGVYSDAYGLAAVVKVGRIQKERRFPAGTDLVALRNWQDQQRDELREQHPTDRRQTVRKDIESRAHALAGRPSAKSDYSHLKAWIPFIGDLLRTEVTRAHVLLALQTWQAAGKAARTIRHRLRVLRELYASFKLPSPAAGVELPKIPAPHPVPVSLETIRSVAASLQQGKRHPKGYGGDSDQAYARFLVRALTGQRPSQIMRAQPADVDLVRRIWFVRAGKGGTAIPLPLNAEMVKAWKLFAAVDAWGTFDARSFSKTIRRHGWPASIRPYNLRHTFAIDHLLHGTSLGEVQGLLGHRQIETTRKFYAPVLTALLTKAVGKRRLGLTTSQKPAAGRPGKRAKAVENRTRAEGQHASAKRGKTR